MLVLVAAMRRTAAVVLRIEDDMAQPREGKRWSGEGPIDAKVLARPEVRRSGPVLALKAMRGDGWG